MRLTGNPTKNATVEVYDEFGNWGPICSRRWNLDAAHIVCRHFGYETALGALQIPIEPELIRPKMLQVNCRITVNKFWFGGNVSEEFASLLQCDTETSAICLCSNYEAGVVCSKG